MALIRTEILYSIDKDQREGGGSPFCDENWRTIAWLLSLRSVHSGHIRMHNLGSCMLKVCICNLMKTPKICEEALWDSLLAFVAVNVTYM